MRWGSNMIFVPHLYVYLHTPSHCADAVVSLANNTTIVGKVATVLADFTARWVQSPSDYNFLVASTINKKWALQHRPVISRKGHGHILYTKYLYEQPHGQLIFCPSQCLAKIHAKTTKNGFRLICEKCNTRVTIPKHQPDWQSILGWQTLIKIAFPQEIQPVTWGLPETPKPDQAPTAVLFSANCTPTTSTRLVVP